MGRGEKFAELVDRLRPNHAKFFEPDTRHVTIPKQNTFFDDGTEDKTKDAYITRHYKSGDKKINITRANRNKKREGTFFEYQWLGLTGGHRGHHDWIYTIGEDDESLVMPDIISHHARELVEVKALLRHCHLSDDQISRIIGLQARWPEYSAFYGITKHNFQGIEPYEGTEQELYRELAHSTEFMLKMSLSLTLALYESKDNSLVYNYHPDERDGLKRFRPGTDIRQNTLMMALEQPEKLIERLGRDPAKYTIERYMSPRQFYINGNYMQPVVMTVIKDASHDEWMGEYGEKYRSKLHIQQIPMDWGNDGYHHLPLIADAYQGITGEVPEHVIGNETHGDAYEPSQDQCAPAPDNDVPF
jgi:hypothetical protein